MAGAFRVREGLSAFGQKMYKTRPQRRSRWRLRSVLQSWDSLDFSSSLSISQLTTSLWDHNVLLPVTTFLLTVSENILNFCLRINPSAVGVLRILRSSVVENVAGEMTEDAFPRTNFAQCRRRKSKPIFGIVCEKRSVPKVSQDNRELFHFAGHNFRTALRQSENKDRDSSEVDCCPDVHQTLSKLLLEEIGSDPDDPEDKCCGSGDHVGARNKIRVARTVSDCNRACGIVPQWSESAPLTHFQHIVRDAVKICDRHLKSTSLWPKPLPRDLVETILQSVRVNSDGDVFDSDIFLPAQDFVFQILTKDYYTQFLESDAFYNYRIDVLTNKILSLKDVMYDDAAAFFFMEYMEKEGHLDLVEFLLTAASITSQLHSDSISPEAAQNDAMVVYDRYISLQATHALGFSDTIRLEVEMSLCRENGLGPDPKTFVRPASVVNTLLTKHFFPEFLKSHLYYTYTQELVTTYQLDHLNARKRMQSSRSEPSKISDETRSVSSSQTTGKALNGMTRSRAESQPKGARKMSTSTSAPVDISVSRRNFGMGQVDSLGRFYSFRDLEGPPGSCDYVVSRDSTGAFSKVLHSFLGKNQKDEEEAAWQMAEMMVRDVTS
ncbi:unnamed protein product, partial [Notodromas monacha]